MVCLVSPVLKTDDHKIANEMNIEKMSKDENCDNDYSLKRLAGGSLVEHTPLFTPNGKHLLVINGNKVIMYSAVTGELIKDLDEFGGSDLIAIEFHLTDLSVLVGCSVKGDVIFWDWDNGIIKKKLKLPIYDISLKSFTLLNMSNGLCALITYADKDNTCKFNIINLAKNTIINCPLELELNNNVDDIITAAETTYFHYFVIAQKQNLLVVDYKTWKTRMWKNAYKVKITVVKLHPTEILVATGDEMGKIFLYRNLFKFGNECNSCLYHWHHTPVRSIAFTASGSGFYSGGDEAVLVKWNINRPNMKNFLPRMDGYICHIAVADQNKKIAVCTSENGIAILDDQFQLKCVLQNFTYIYDNNFEESKFPVGLVLNPINNSLALNGRSGHLQIFSTFTKSLLYNIDIVMHNKLSAEKNKLLYDIMVTTADFNVNWMATGELWDDHEHFPEIRLKFWQFVKAKQNYSLNTCIELPHENGIRAIKFSKKQSDKNLFCATLGNDNFIKMWSLVNLNNKQDRKWICVATNNYKDYAALSIDFAFDGSLLAVGYGNALCIFKTDTLKIKAILTPPPLYDGSVQKVEIFYNEKNLQNKQNVNEYYKKTLELFRNFEENSSDEGIIKFIQKSSSRTKKKLIPSAVLSNDKNNEILFKKILGLSELNLFQKLLIFQKLNMTFSIPKTLESKMVEYINTNLNNEKRERYVNNLVNFISPRDRFKAKYKLKKYYWRKNFYQKQINETLTPLLNLLKIEEQNNDVEMEALKPDCNGFSNGCPKNDNEEVFRKKINEISKSPDVYSFPIISEIKTVNFGKGDFTHMVIITTEHRVIVWNILTLRIQFILKLSVKIMTVDDLTGLCGAVTNQNELYIFLPNAPLYLYRRSEMPEILSACWVPRKLQRSTSLNVDWQSYSVLYFLTKKQEIVYLSSKKYDLKDSDILINYSTEMIRHSIYDVHLLKNKNVEGSVQNSEQIGVLGKAEVKSIIQMATHTSAPMNLLSSNFIKSLITKHEDENDSVKHTTISKTTIESDETDGENNDMYFKIKERKKIFNHTSKIPNNIIPKKIDKKQLSIVLEESLLDIEF